MKDAACQELLASIKQARKIRRGRLKPARVTTFCLTDVKSIRAKLDASQTEFALMIGVSVATLRTWKLGAACLTARPSPCFVWQQAIRVQWPKRSIGNLTEVRRDGDCSTSKESDGCECKSTLYTMHGLRSDSSSDSARSISLWLGAI
jgi:putative transcriptional regulator